MNDASDSKAAAKPQRKPLSLRRARAIVIAMTGFLLLVAAEGVHDIHVGKTFFALLDCLVAAFSLLTLPIHFFLYLQVKKGVTIMLRPVPLPSLPDAPFLISVICMALMTLMVIAAGLVTYYIGFVLSHSLSARIIIAVVNLCFWLITAFFWYRLMTEKRSTKKIGPILEQTEDVWPPAPQIPKSE
jgi:Na+/melibiose symporter-like transporter